MMSETFEFDIRGQVCPSCLLLSLREVNRHHDALQSGTLKLVVLTDSRYATGTVPGAVQNMGLVAKVDKEEGYYRIVISRPRENS